MGGLVTFLGHALGATTQAKTLKTKHVSLDSVHLSHLTLPFPPDQLVHEIVHTISRRGDDLRV